MVLVREEVELRVDRQVLELDRFVCRLGGFRTAGLVGLARGRRRMATRHAILGVAMASLGLSSFNEEGADHKEPPTRKESEWFS